MKKLLIALGVLAAVVVGTWLFVRNRLRAEIEKRCSAALDADCSIDGISLHLAGASANGVHVTAKAGAVQGDIDAIEADFRWLPLLTGTPQPVVVRVVHPKIEEEIPVGNLSIALKNMGNGEMPDGTPSSLTLDGLTVRDGEVDVRVNLVASVRVEGIAVDWAPKQATQVRWSDAGIETLLGKDGTGECTLDAPPTGHMANVECPKVKLSTKIDLEKVKSLSDLTKIFLKQSVQ